MISTVQDKKIRIEWRCWSCSRLIMKYAPQTTSDGLEHKCKCGAMNVLKLEKAS